LVERAEGSVDPVATVLTIFRKFIDSTDSKGVSGDFWLEFGGAAGCWRERKV
jgi:hypothetical protein